MPEQLVLANHQKTEISAYRKRRARQSLNQTFSSKCVNQQNNNKKQSKKAQLLLTHEPSWRLPDAKGSASALTNKRILKRCRLRCQQRQHPVAVGGCLGGLLPDGAASSAWITGPRMPQGRGCLWGGLVWVGVFVCGFGFFERLLFSPCALRFGFSGAGLRETADSFPERSAGVQPAADSRGCRSVCVWAAAGGDRDRHPPGSPQAPLWLPASWEDLPRKGICSSRSWALDTDKITTSPAYSRCNDVGNPLQKEERLQLPGLKAGSRAEGNNFSHSSKNLQDLFN